MMQNSLEVFNSFTGTQLYLLIQQNMKKKNFKIQNAQVLSTKAQREIKGGIGLTECEPGCFPDFFSAIGGTRCAIPGPGGLFCVGVIQNNLCCV